MASEALQRRRDLDYLWGEHLYISLERVYKSNNTIRSTDSTLFLASDSPLRGAVVGSNSAIVVKGATKTFRAALNTQARLQQHQKVPHYFHQPQHTLLLSLSFSKKTPHSLFHTSFSLRNLNSSPIHQSKTRFRTSKNGWKTESRPQKGQRATEGHKTSGRYRSIRIGIIWMRALFCPRLLSDDVTESSHGPTSNLTCDSLISVILSFARLCQDKSAGRELSFPFISHSSHSSCQN